MLEQRRLPRVQIAQFLFHLLAYPLQSALMEVVLVLYCVEEVLPLWIVHGGPTDVRELWVLVDYLLLQYVVNLVSLCLKLG